MSKRLAQLLVNISDRIGTDAYDEFTARFGLQESQPSSVQEGACIKAILDDIIDKNGEELACKLMRPCGYHCIGNSVIDEAKGLFKKAPNMPEFLDTLNQNHIGGGHLRLSGDQIIGEYDHCYCGTVKNIKGISPVYCECSAGWYEQLFASVLEKPVEVIVKRSILQGDPTCLFEITIGD